LRTPMKHPKVKIEQRQVHDAVAIDLARKETIEAKSARRALPLGLRHGESRICRCKPESGQGVGKWVLFLGWWTFLVVTVDGHVGRAALGV
jgi:hypothetical protein